MEDMVFYSGISDFTELTREVRKGGSFFMKKLVSVLLALVLVMMATTVFAATPSKSGGDIPKAKTKTETDVSFGIVDDTPAIAALKEKVFAAIQNNDLSQAIPEDVLTLIPEDYRNAENLVDNLKEFVAVKCEGTIPDTLTLVLQLDTPYDDGIELYVVLALMDEANEGEVTEWIVKEGAVKVFPIFGMSHIMALRLLPWHVVNCAQIYLKVAVWAAFHSIPGRNSTPSLRAIEIQFASLRTLTVWPCFS